MLKLSHLLVTFLLLASLFQPLMARYLSDEEALRVAVAKEDQVDTCEGKHSWPELVGAPLKSAKEIIEKENPAASVVVLYPLMPMPLNYVCGRVFVVVNWKLIVRSIPTMEVCCWAEAQRMA